MSDRAAPACIILGHRRRTLAHLRTFDMYVELCSQRPVHAWGCGTHAPHLRSVCICVWRMRAASLCVVLCAMHSSSSYQPSPPPIRVQSSSPPSPLPALRPALRPLASSAPIVLSAPQPSAPTTWHTLAHATIHHAQPSQHQAHPVATGLGLPQLLPGM